MALTTIAAGLSGLKAAADMTKALRDGVKAGAFKADEIYGRIGEIYDYIVDSKAALVDAQDENQNLRQELRSLKDAGDLESRVSVSREGSAAEIIQLPTPPVQNIGIHLAGPRHLGQ